MKKLNTEKSKKWYNNVIRWLTTRPFNRYRTEKSSPQDCVSLSWTFGSTPLSTPLLIFRLKYARIRMAFKAPHSPVSVNMGGSKMNIDYGKRSIWTTYKTDLVQMDPSQKIKFLSFYIIPISVDDVNIVNDPLCSLSYHANPRIFKKF